MKKYCVWCDQLITEKRKNNRIYCSDKCVGERHTANNKNQGFGPAAYRDSQTGIKEQGMPEGGLPWALQYALDLTEDSPRITEDPLYLARCMEALPSPKYEDGTSAVKPKPGNLKFDWAPKKDKTKSGNFKFDWAPKKNK